jgi:hypothetical protein
MKKRAKQEHVDNPEAVARQARIQRLRSLAKDEFYPALVGATVSVDEAKMLLQAMSTLIMDVAFNVLREKKVAEIKESLLKTLCPNNDRIEEIGKLIDVFLDETLFDTKGQIEGMASVIDYMIRSEMQDRTLNSFTPDWDKMMSK